MEKTPLACVVEVSGVGYEVQIPVPTSEGLPHPGELVLLHTLVLYREDAQTLYGFRHREERDFFRTLVEKVSGVGPKVALSLLSKMSLPMLRSAIEGEDVALLSRTPGVGRKTAERIIVELKDKMATGGGTIPGISPPRHPQGTPVSIEEQTIADAILALVALGYKPAEAEKSVRKARLSMTGSISAEALIKRSLQ